MNQMNHTNQPTWQRGAIAFLAGSGLAFYVIESAKFIAWLIS